ncbi:MAG: hypothetical protein VXV96_13645 [Bdellovibrionota bacterium]|nr:hypothetical protein [Bdellovibrionota bacterium]
MKLKICLSLSVILNVILVVLYSRLDYFYQSSNDLQDRINKIDEVELVYDVGRMLLLHNLICENKLAKEGEILEEALDGPHSDCKINSKISMIDLIKVRSLPKKYYNQPLYKFENNSVKIIYPSEPINDVTTDRVFIIDLETPSHLFMRKYVIQSSDVAYD